MGKKKKKGGGKKSARAQSNTSKAETEVKVEMLDRDGRQFYETQKRDVQHRVERFQRECDELELLNEKLKKNRLTLNDDMEDIKEYLKGRVDEKMKICTELQDELKTLQEAYNIEQRNYKEAEERLEKEFKDTKEQLESDGLITQGKLAALEEYRALKEEMQEKFKEMEEKMQLQQEMHREEIYQMERQTVVQKDSLRKEMLERVNHVASEFRKVSNRQMAETTQKTIEENADLNRQLAALSDKIMRLISDNDSLKAKEKELGREVDVLTDLDKEMQANVNKSLKTIRTLTDECRDRDAQLMDLEERAESADDIKSEHTLLSQQAQAQTEELATMRAELVNQEQQVAAAEQQLHSERRAHRHILRLLRQSERAVSDSFATLTPDEEMTESEAIILRRKMLISLLDLLNLAARVGLGPEPASLGRAGNRGSYQYKPLTASSSALAAGGVSSRKTLATASGELISSRLGELGLAPVPNRVGAKSQFVAEQLASQLPPGALLQPIQPKARSRPVPSGVF